MFSIYQASWPTGRRRSSQSVRVFGMVHASSPSLHKGEYTCCNHIYRMYVLPQFLDLKTLVFAMFGLKKKTARPQNKVFSRPPICENAILRCGNAIFR